jgi:hypothetical protein
MFPLYTYENPKTKKRIDVVQSMREEHVYIDEKGVEWKRVFTIPQASIDTKINPESANDFINKTGSKKGSYGDLLDASKEASLAREKRYGKDPLKEKAIKKWKKETGKKIHPSEIKNIKNIDVSL